VDFIGKPDVMWRKLFDVQRQVTNFEVRGDDLYVMTHKNAPRFKLLRTSLAHPDLANAEMVVPPSDKVITGFSRQSGSAVRHGIRRGNRKAITHLVFKARSERSFPSSKRFYFNRRWRPTAFWVAVVSDFMDESVFDLLLQA